MTQSYKALKEDFVSNLSGGSVLEVNYVTAVAPVRPQLALAKPHTYCMSLVSLFLVVGTSSTASFLRQLWPNADACRLPSQCYVPPIGYNHILFQASASQWSPHTASHRPLHPPRKFQVL